MNTDNFDWCENAIVAIDNADLKTVRARPGVAIDASTQTVGAALLSPAHLEFWLPVLEVRWVLR